jgi:glutamate synthase (NADPH/NADH) large chain
MTGGTVVILGNVGDNFAAGMTGGMAFVYDLNDQFEKKINPETVIWQKLETQYWIDHLKSLIKEHYYETNSSLSKKIIDNYNHEISNFFQVCPKEMINKLKNPITNNPIIKEVS